MRFSLILFAVVVLAACAGCGGSRHYTPKQVQSAFAAQGIQLRYRHNLPNSVAMLDRDGNVAVSIYGSASGAHAMYLTAPPFQGSGPPPFHREEKANLIAFFKPSLAESVKRALARIH